MIGNGGLNPEMSGGGELIDQGMHLIDLARWFLGDFAKCRGMAGAYFWKTPVEDNGFLLLATAAGQVAFLHASWTEWKNIFSFEIYGRTGKLEITGLGGSYGVERLVFYQMTPEMGPPVTTSGNIRWRMIPGKRSSRSSCRISARDGNRIAGAGRRAGCAPGGRADLSGGGQ